MPRRWVLFPLLAVLAGAQTRPVEGLRQATPRVFALTGARIVAAPGRVIPRGTVVLRDGVITALGADVPVPADAVLLDRTGRTVYPGFLDAFASLPLAAPPAWAGAKHWNPAVRPEVEALSLYRADEKALAGLRRLGFTAAAVVPVRGIFAGWSAVVSLRPGAANEVALRRRAAQHVYLRRAEKGYPNSLMGAIALVRQTFLDARWYAAAWEVYRRFPAGKKPPETNPALAALAAARRRQAPVVVAVGGAQDVLRAVRLARELELDLVVKGGGDSYELVQAVAAAKVPLIVPLRFPPPPAVDTPEEAARVSLRELQRWELAPSNPARLARAGVPFALTTADLPDVAEFLPRLRRALRAGLSREAALAALTTTPAQLLGLGDRLGTLAVGKLAHLVVTDGPLFARETQVLEVWVDGRRFEVTSLPPEEVRGTWAVRLRTPAGEHPFRLLLQGEARKPTGSVRMGEKTQRVPRVRLDGRRLRLVLPATVLGVKGYARLSGRLWGGKITGFGRGPGGEVLTWTATRSEPYRPAPAPRKEGKGKPPALDPVPFPLGAHARRGPPPRPEHLLVRGATIWTCGPQGLLRDADLLVERGKIQAVGHGLPAPPGAVVVEARGLHVTAGLIDCHSHMAVAGGANESGQAVSAEVRIGDVLDATDISLYRALAGGVTCAHILHGSANPIGGQNQVIKLRWGLPPEGLKFTAAPPTIKFALGENVTRANARGPRTRYPATRMGVEQLIRDRLQAAREYLAAWEAYRHAPDRERRIPPRRDLELEALGEILRGRRWVHCHAYRQDEILMLVRVAEDFGFRVAAFQHALEGYKVAEVLVRHGAGASTFSDWWAYKMEVMDAIPYNGALMHRVGVVVSFNSDSRELGRRLNTEAAKAVKYGGLSPEEAIKFVTLNPARQLRIEGVTGCLAPGKDADFVVWSGPPLATDTVCLQTWIDGRKYFDREEDLRERAAIARERARLIQEVLAARERKEGQAKAPRRRSLGEEKEP